MGNFKENPKQPYKVKMPKKIRERITMGAAEIKREARK